jgi:alpha-tubulin suppressor-like RCC1 family protein
VSDTGEVFSWGETGDALGHEKSSDDALRNQPTRIESLARGSHHILQVACSSNQTNLEHFTLFLTASGDVLTCGNNRYRQLGDADVEITSRSVPSLIRFDTSTSDSLPNRIVRVWAGAVHAVALDSEGRIFTWGCNILGQCKYTSFFLVFFVRVMRHMFLRWSRIRHDCSETHCSGSHSSQRGKTNLDFSSP